eukprot:m.5698 g.5698  ORF g.5698 m.5698 type:complete len:232 (+) comp13849_c0_seq2:1222-1917(+)
MGRRGRKSEYSHSYKLTWTEAVCRQYEETVAYRQERKAREYRHVPFAWDDPSEDDTSSQSTDDWKPESSVGVVAEDEEEEGSDGEAAVEEEEGEEGEEEGKKDNREEAKEEKQPERMKRRRPTKVVLDLKKRGPFHVYGWANESKADGYKDRRTYNVKADGREVHPTALKALKRRQVDEQMREELRKRRSLEQKRLEGAFNMGPVHRDDNVWLTEYQRNYVAYGKRKHPYT